MILAFLPLNSPYSSYVFISKRNTGFIRSPRAAMLATHWLWRVESTPRLDSFHIGKLCAVVLFSSSMSIGYGLGLGIFNSKKKPEEINASNQVRLSKGVVIENEATVLSGGDRQPLQDFK